MTKQTLLSYLLLGGMGLKQYDLFYEKIEFRDNGIITIRKVFKIIDTLTSDNKMMG